MTDRSGRTALSRPGIVDRFAAAAGAVIALAALFRLWLIGIGLPPFDSDEGTMGLMALHIEQGARPVFFYGQAYMGSLEAYLGAAFFSLLGPSDAALRAGLVLLNVLFLGCMYALARMLYGPAVALVSLCLLALGSRELLARELKAVGGYPELLLFGGAVLLGATVLVLHPRVRGLRRVWGFGLVGLLAGLGVWSDPLALPFAAAALVLLAITCPRQTFGIPGLALALGLLVGLAPAIAYNTDPSVTQSTWSSVAQLVRSGGSGHAAGGSTPLGRRVAGTVAVSVPVMTGGSGLCRLQPQSAWPLPSHAAAQTVTCTAVHAVWGAGFIFLLLLAICLALMGLIRSVQWPDRQSRETSMAAADPHPPTPSPIPGTACRVPFGWGGVRRGGAQSRALLWCRLALLAPAAVTLLVFMLSSAPARAPWYNVRYLAGIWIALPAVVALLLSSRGPRALRLARFALLAVFALALVLDATSLLGNRSYTSWMGGQERGLASTLERRGVTHFYTDYWTCDWVAFEARERLTCAVLDAHLRPSLDRYLPYRAAVRADPHAPYVFRQGTAEGNAFARLAGRYPALYRVSRSPVFVIYWRA